MPTAWRGCSPCPAPTSISSPSVLAMPAGSALPCNSPCCAIPAPRSRNLEQPPEPLVMWLATQLDIPAAAFADYAHRPQTMTDHARRLARDLGPASARGRRHRADDRGCRTGRLGDRPRTADRRGGGGGIAHCRIILPPAAVIERAAIAGRARARKRAIDALLAGCLRRTDCQARPAGWSPTRRSA